MVIRKCPVCGEEMNEPNKGVRWCGNDDCYIIGLPEDYETYADRLEKEVAELHAEIDRYLIQHRGEIETEARIGIDGKLKYVKPQPTNDPVGIIMASSDKFVRVFVRIAELESKHET